MFLLSAAAGGSFSPGKGGGAEAAYGCKVLIRLPADAQGMPLPAFSAPADEDEGKHAEELPEAAEAKTGKAGRPRKKAKRLEPCRTRNKAAAKSNPERLIRDVERHPDACRHERAERFGCSQRGICEALRRLKISPPKKNFHPKANEEACRLFKKKISVYGRQYQCRRF